MIVKKYLQHIKWLNIKGDLVKKYLFYKINMVFSVKNNHPFCNSYTTNRVEMYLKYRIFGFITNYR